ncbi:hypothetical protein [Sulfurimonas sp.]|uniref:hypothetical protein n=1 Tax=Sulfurimonas sp. TaxID=2022749 RepID=UPI002B47B1CB|nr:hypothetical protein [Sulfurimonas sp.]
MPTLAAKKKREEEKKKAEELKRRNTAFIVPVESPREKYRKEVFERRANKPAPKEKIAPYKRKNKAILQNISILTCHNTAVYMEAIQWVDLEKDKKNLDNIRTDIERLGQDVKLRVKIDLPNTEHTFAIEQKKRIADKPELPFETVSKKEFTETSDEKGYIFIKDTFQLEDEDNYKHFFKASSDIEQKSSAGLITKKYEVKILFDKNKDKNKITEHSIQVLKNIGKEIKLKTIYVTSMERTAGEQLEAMFSLIKSRGVKTAYKLYGKAGDKVIKAYENKDLKNDLERKSAMLKQIEKESPSSHMNNDASKQIIDISETRMPKDKKSLFKDAVENNKDIDNNKFFTPPKDPAFHIEIINQKTEGK